MTRDTVLFDINETVLNLEGLKPAFEKTFQDPSVMSTWFAMLLQSSTVCALTNVKTGFAALAGIMLDTIAAKRGVTLTDQQKNTLLSGFANLKAHDDILPALAALRKAGYRTVAFSNSSLDLVTNQIENAGLNNAFDKIISVEEVGSFKPDPKVYRHAAQKLDRDVTDLRLVATHDWDTHGALCADLLAGYIDRTGAAYHPLYKRPTVYANTMTDVVNQIIADDQRT